MGQGGSKGRREEIERERKGEVMEGGSNGGREQGKERGEERQHCCAICRGNVSESEGEELAGEGEVTLSQDLPGRGNIKSEQSAIRLSEVRGVASS